MDDRMPTGIAEERVLAAFSNGGNLAWATLADTNVELPDIQGIAVFETPASSQMALGEPGTGNRNSPLHTEGSCEIDDESALVCDYQYQHLAFDMDTDPDTSGTLFLDIDQNGSIPKKSISHWVLPKRKTMKIGRIRCKPWRPSRKRN